MKTAMNRLLVEFGTPEELIAAAKGLADLAARQLEAYTPFPIPEVEQSVAPGATPVAGIALGGGLLGGVGAYLLQWLLVAHLYPLNVGGRPPHFPLAFVPITFEMCVLGAAGAAFVSVLLLGRLFALWRPAFDADGFESATSDHFWLEIALTASGPDGDAIVRALHEFGPLTIRRVGQGQ